MNFRLLVLMLSLSLPATAVLAQDALPEGSDVAAPEGGPAADMPAGDAAAAPTDDAAETTEDGSGADKPISVGLLLGYGIGIDTGGVNPYGLGFGVRGGYNLDEIFLGARFVYYLGESSLNVWELGIEGGYDIDAGGVTIRPGLGLGIANTSAPSIVVLGTTVGGGSSTDLYIAPGVGVLGDVSENIFIGAEARFQLVLASGGTGKALILLANAGMRF